LSEKTKIASEPIYDDDGQQPLGLGRNVSQGGMTPSDLAAIRWWA
jgi:hypothetical protein